MMLKGDFDSAGADVFDVRTRELVDADARDVLIEMSQVDFMSSAGLRSIHNLFYKLHPEGSEEHKRILKEGVRKGTYKAPHLKLLNPQKRVLESLKAVGVDMYMSILSGDELKAVETF
jgi:hypothetical protein